MVCPTNALRSLTHTVLFNTAGVSSLGSERARVPVDWSPDGSLDEGVALAN